MDLERKKTFYIEKPIKKTIKINIYTHTYTLYQQVFSVSN